VRAKATRPLRSEQRDDVTRLDSQIPDRGDSAANVVQLDRHSIAIIMSPRRTTVEHSKGVFEVEWPLFGELSRGLALKVARDYDPDVVVGIATAGVVPGAVIAAILGREFHSMVVSRRFGAETVRQTPAVLSAAPSSVRDRRVLVVDETCDTGDTLRLAVAAMVNAGAAEVRTAVAFKTGPYDADFHALATESTIILPWDREVLIDGELLPNPLYAAVLKTEG
jgi:hypoxanthine phosphoribosyltransferase